MSGLTNGSSPTENLLSAKRPFIVITKAFCSPSKERSLEKRKKKRSGGGPRIGVYVCHCGVNIGATVDVSQVVEFAASLPGVVVARDYAYVCSDPGQKLIVEDISKLGINRVVTATCSPRLHEPTFRKTLQEAGLNPYCLDIANIREQCSWVHSDISEGTEKAKRLVASAVARSNLLQPLEEKEVPVAPEALVIGGGISGIQAALDIADAGFKVHLVEKEPSIGGHMAQLDKTFPTLDCSACILTPKMVEVQRHPNIRLSTYSEVEDISGYVGNFQVKIKKKARAIDEEKCTACGDCWVACPVSNEPQIPAAKKYSQEIDKKERKRLDRILAQHAPGNPGVPGKEMLIQVLQDVNQEYRYLPPFALKYVSEKLSVPLSTVYHVATFYTAFSLKPRGKHLITVCMGTACHARGAPRVLAELERQLEISPGQTTKDQLFSLETVNCLGCCALGPVVMIDQDYHQATPAKVKALLKNCQRE
jgi:NADH:ubiquinone oxidoreductase subunit E/NAD-dependent dihydropyrimidine dehydrogenase PreA subunit